MRLVLLVFLCLVLMPSRASADAFSIHVLDTKYSVTLIDQTYNGGVLTQTVHTTTDTAPVSADYLVQAVPPYTFMEGGSASADLFEISTSTSQGKFRPQDGSLDQIWAYATSAVTFAPLASGTASVDVSFLLGGMAFYSESSVDLIDLTASTNVWTLGWAYRDDPTMRALSAAPTIFATSFDASHIYQLTLFGRTDARDDSQSLTATVNGLQTVPEPSTVLLMGVGAGAAAIRRRRRDSAG